MKRRKFITRSLPALAAVPLYKDIYNSFVSPETSANDIKEYLSRILYTKEEVDGWFDGKLFPFSKYHSEFGWLLNDNSFRDGLNNSWSIYTYRNPDGERKMSNYSDKHCRINTYGDSFTQCHQVSDNETWQEVLASHIQEPVRNFGIGGWSAWQAYLRMLKEEKRTPGDLIIFNFYDDDHLRNLDSWRNIRARKHPQHIEATLPFLKVDMSNGIIRSFPNPCPKPEMYYKLCNLEETYGLFKDDFTLRIMISHQKSSEDNPGKKYKDLMELSRTHGIETRIDESATLSKNADNIHREAAIFSSCKLVDVVEEYAIVNKKKVLYVLSYPAQYIAAHHDTGIRWDQKFIDYLKTRNLSFVDMSQKHLDDFSSYKTDINSYLAKFFIGHYNPAGNFFCAHSIRDKVLEFLNPKPLPYLLKETINT